MAIKAYFENHKNVILENLSTAEHSVIIAVAWINFKDYFSAFENLLKKKINLSIICTDNKQNRSHQNEIDSLIKNGANIILLKMHRITNHMHHKFAVIDNQIVLTGSFNWSPNATKSFENLMVISGEVNLTTSFLNEFDKLTKIKTVDIPSLQKSKKCKNCSDGELFNILVFSERRDKNFETSGDLLEICISCLEFCSIEDCITDPQLYLTLNSYSESRDEYELDEIDRDINSFLNNYASTELLIHAIGKVARELSYLDDEIIFTNIIWKNKFVGDRIPDSLESEFDVYYDN